MTNRATTQSPGAVPGLFLDILNQSHTLIAGTTGSGKSTLLNGLICAVLARPSAGTYLLLIDPKRVELSRYKDAPHTVGHATEPHEIRQAFRFALDLIDDRYRRMEAAGLRMFPGADLYIIVDELADLMTTQRAVVAPMLQRICQIGRAARVHVIAATQCPLAKVIPTEIKVNFTAVVGLRTQTRQHSRNIIDQPGCETLPSFGECLYSRSRGLARYKVPNTTEHDITAALEWCT